jgi:AraC family transcriptional regulator
MLPALPVTLSPVNAGASYTLDRLAEAVEYIEAHLDRRLSVADIARRARYSPFHFHRTFSAVVGETVMEYVRGRRLTGAANALRDTDRPILSIAFDAGFDSQEAFTRAFRRRFGTTPGRCRDCRPEIRPFFRAPLTRDALEQHLARNRGEIEMKPKFVELPAFEVVGVSGRFTADKTEGIPVLWDRFVTAWSGAGLPFPTKSYGLCYDEGGGEPQESPPFTYMAAFDRPEGDLPEGMEARTVPANRYAVFTHVGEVHRIKETYRHIFGTWLPASGMARAEGPDFELYDERFDEKTMGGEVDIYVPVRA